MFSIAGKAHDSRKILVLVWKKTKTELKARIFTCFGSVLAVSGVIQNIVQNT